MHVLTDMLAQTYKHCECASVVILYLPGRTKKDPTSMAATYVRVLQLSETPPMHFIE